MFMKIIIFWGTDVKEYIYIYIYIYIWLDAVADTSHASYISMIFLWYSFEVLRRLTRGEEHFSILGDILRGTCDIEWASYNVVRYLQLCSSVSFICQSIYLSLYLSIVYIYIYIYMCVCVCVCVCEPFDLSINLSIYISIHICINR